MTSGVAGTLAHAEPALVVRGNSECPSAAMISHALSAVRPDGALPEGPVAVDVTEDRLTVTLGEAATARREIPADRDCAVRAASVALVIAAWSGDLASRPSASPELQTASPVVVAKTPLPPATTATHVIELDGSAFYSPVWGHQSGIWLGVGRVPREGGVGARLLGAYQGARDVALEGGANQLYRTLLGAAVTFRRQGAHGFGSGDLGLVGVLTHAQGVGYQTNRGDSAANLGGLVDLRGGLLFGRLQLWAGARVLGLVHSDSVKIQSSSPGVADSATLRAWDAQLGLGMGVRFE
jgi:hypothetical protein